MNIRASKITFVEPTSVALITRALITATCLGGCSDGGSKMDHNEMCADPRGSYHVVFDERSGDCHIGRYESVGYVEDDAPDPDCTGSTIISPDKCDVDINVTCIERNEVTGEIESRAKIVGTISKNSDGTKLEGVVSFTAYEADGSYFCMSVFDGEYTKL